MQKLMLPARSLAHKAMYSGMRQASALGISASADERLEAARLVGRLYRKEGYLPACGEPEAPFLTPHHLRPQATVFIAREGGRVAGTLTTVVDSPDGLPLESLYGDEVAELRACNRVPCEICSLAVDAEHAKSSLRLVYRLFQCATVYLVHFTPVTDVLITLKPAHESFYRRLKFKAIGQPKADARFCDAPTVAMRLTRDDAMNSSVENRLAAVFGQSAPEKIAAIA